MLMIILEEPRHDILKHSLGTRLDNVPMARNQTIKVPPSNPAHGLCERNPVLSKDIPSETPVSC